MIYSLLQLIVEGLNRFIADKKGKADNYAIAANINNIINSPSMIGDKIIVSIINIEEDKSIRNAANYVDKRTEGNVYTHTPVSFNLSCLFTLYSPNKENYAAVDLLTYVMEYFHIHSRFKISTNQSNSKNLNSSAEVHVIADWISLDIEQTNNLWNIFGNKYHPSIIYQFKNLTL